MRNTHPKSVTRPLEEATMAPSSPTTYSAEMLSCRNRPSGSFFCRAYHFPTYCQRKSQTSHSPNSQITGHYTRLIHGAVIWIKYLNHLLDWLLQKVEDTVTYCRLFASRWSTHSFGVKVLFDREAVHHAGGQALLHTGQDQHQRGKHLEVHSGRKPGTCHDKQQSFKTKNPPESAAALLSAEPRRRRLWVVPRRRVTLL